MGISVSSSKQLQYMQEMHLKRLQLRHAHKNNRAATINPEPSHRVQESDKIDRVHTSPNEQIHGPLQQTIDFDREETMPPTQRRIVKSQNSGVEPKKGSNDQLVIRSSNLNEDKEKPINTRAKKVNLNKKK